MGSHDKKFLQRLNSSNYSSILGLFAMLIGIGTVFVCCVSCAASAPHTTRVNISEFNTGRLLDSTVAFVTLSEAPAEDGALSSEVTWEGPYCAGFFIDETHLVGAAHCFRNIIQFEMNGMVFQFPTIDNPVGQRAYFVQRGQISWEGTITGPTVAAVVRLWDDHNDLVILQVVDRAFHPRAFSLLAIDTPSVGDEVFHVGHPYEITWSFFSGIVSQDVREDDRDPHMINILQVTVPTSPGSSGGPLVNSNGETVGFCSYIVEGNGSHISIYHSANVIRRLLRSEHSTH